MAERRLLHLQAYETTNEPNMQQWRLINSPGLPFHDNLANYTWYPPSYCKPAVITEVSRVLGLMSLSGAQWQAFQARFIGVLIKGPRGNLLQGNGDYRQAIIEKVPVPAGLCGRCAAQLQVQLDQQEGASQKTIAPRASGQGFYTTPT